MCIVNKENRSEIHRDSHENISDNLDEKIFNRSPFDLLPSARQKDISKEAVLTNINHILEYILQKEPHSYVLDAKPGHGKTTALYLVAEYINNELPKSPGLLIVLKEKQQQDDMNELISEISKHSRDYKSEKKYKENQILYVNADTISYARKYIKNSKVVVITHARLERLFLNRNSYKKGIGDTNYFDGEDLLSWGGMPRKIIIDEAPELFQSDIFKLDTMNWLDPGFQMLQNDEILKESLASQEITFTEFKLFIRFTIQYLIGAELLFNKNLYTTKLSISVMDEKQQELLELFFSCTRKIIRTVKRNQEFINKFRWLDRLYHEDSIGYINPEQKLNHKNILCNKIIDYKSLGSILILDGSSSYTKTKYESLGYKIIYTKDYTKYDRLKISLRKIKTTSGARGNPNYVTQKLIAQDIENILADSEAKSIFPLMTKDEIKIYRSLGVITEDQLQYFELDVKGNTLPMNLLNTRGKNHLAEESAMYLTSLPIKPPDYYKQLALSLNKKSNKLSLKLNKSEDDGITWFEDPFIQKIYKEEIFSELVQIIHRTNIRRLNEGSDKKVYIYIASDLIEFLTNLFEPYDKIDFVTDSNHKEKLTLELNAKKNAQTIIEVVNKKIDLSFPLYPGKINSIVKDFLNDFYSFEKYQYKDDTIKLIDDIFAQYNLKIIFMDNSKHYKKIDILDRNLRLEN